tara:strand:- start:1074 stop:1589 length:516 start_codon:yes stop_codon:yes gene_type:complete
MNKLNDLENEIISLFFKKCNSDYNSKGAYPEKLLELFPELNKEPEKFVIKPSIHLNINFFFNSELVELYSEHFKDLDNIDVDIINIILKCIQIITSIVIFDYKKLDSMLKTNEDIDTFVSNHNLFLSKNDLPKKIKYYYKEYQKEGLSYIFDSIYDYANLNCRKELPKIIF